MIQTTKSIIEEDLFDVLGAGEIPEEEKIALLYKMIVLVQQRVFNRALEEMSDETKDRLEKALEEDESPEVMEVFMQENIPNFAEIIDSESKKLRHELVISMAI